jgi:hypothetical protein
MAEWGFLTNHARILLHIAHDPCARPRDIAASLGPGRADPWRADHDPG